MCLKIARKEGHSTWCCQPCSRNCTVIVEELNLNYIMFITQMISLLGYKIHNCCGLALVVHCSKIKHFNCSAWKEPSQWSESSLSMNIVILKRCFERRMQPVKVCKPTVEETITILKGIKRNMKITTMFYRWSMLPSSYPNRYIQTVSFPIKLLDLWWIRI